MNACMVVYKNYHYDPRLRRFAEALADAGVNVDVLCLRDPNKSVHNSYEKIRVFTIPFSRWGHSWSNYVFGYSLALLWFSCRLLMLHLKKRYSVIQVHNVPDFLVLAAFIPRLLGAKVVLDIRDPMPEFYMAKYARKADSLGAKLLGIEERLSAALAHAVIAANTNFKHNHVARGIPADKITVVNNVADSRWFNRGTYEQEHSRKKAHFTLIFPGTIAPRYGLDVALRALPLVVEKIPQLRLLIIGTRTPYVDELVALAEQLGVSSFVEIKPVIPVDEVPRQIIQADIGIYPALPDAHMSIATPTKVLEYAAMGIPVLASRLKILEDMFDDSSIQFFEPGNVEEFAFWVLELFHNPKRRTELVRNADRGFVRSHSWENERQSYFNMLNRLLETQAKTKERIVYPSI